jgi:flagellin-like protein
VNITLTKLRTSKKGLSEVIGSLILIMIVSISGVIVYAYSVNIIGTSSTDFSIRTVQNEELLKEKFQILRVWMHQNQMNLTILNWGQTDFTTAAVYVNGLAVIQFTSKNSVTIGPGELANVEFTLPFTAQLGSNLEVLVVSDRGGKNSAVYQV